MVDMSILQYSISDHSAITDQCENREIKTTQTVFSIELYHVTCYPLTISLKKLKFSILLPFSWVSIV